jgi:CheY-like chemotaxis protein
MDVKMPLMDGFTTTRHIKKLGLPVKVILISMVVSSKAEAMAAGADDFISKNEPPERMLSVLRSLDFADSETFSQ